ncbi:MAG: hypothetical protein ABI835_04895, partial [Chloroflexota bacterium]
MDQLIFNSFKEQAKNSKSISTDQIVKYFEQQRQPIERPKVTKFLQLLDKENFGNFKVGRRGQPSRFEAYESLYRIGQIAAGSTE